MELYDFICTEISYEEWLRTPAPTLTRRFELPNGNIIALDYDVVGQAVTLRLYESAKQSYFEVDQS